jgi:hypothetical protein
MKQKEITNMFGGKNGEMYNALYSALLLCAKDEFGDKEEVYRFIAETPKASLVTLLVDKLLSLGYKIENYEKQ